MSAIGIRRRSLSCESLPYVISVPLVTVTLEVEVRWQRVGSEVVATKPIQITCSVYPAGDCTVHHSSMRYTTLVGFILAYGSGRVHGFVAPSTSLVASTSTTSCSTSQLHALPPMIIGPMIKKMREENEKKNEPLATPTEAANEAPGLRIGKGAWRWPGAWPYSNQFFLANKEAEARNRKAQLEGMASMLSGVAQAQGRKKRPSAKKNSSTPSHF